jgi:hypothetical protein
MHAKLSLLPLAMCRMYPVAVTAGNTIVLTPSELHCTYLNSVKSDTCNAALAACCYVQDVPCCGDSRLHLCAVFTLCEGVQWDTPQRVQSDT